MIVEVSERRIATTLGMFAVVFWGMTVAFSRSLTEQLGVLTAACFIYIVGGGLGSIYVLCRAKERRKLASVPTRYWLGCGVFFVLNIVCFHIAVGLASGGQRVVEIGLVNYLWTSLTLILSIPILKKRARLGLAPGIAIACGGIVISALQWEPLSWAAFLGNVRGDLLPYLLVFIGALSWALYSNLSGRWGAQAEGWPVPIFLLVTGVIFLGFRLTVSETSVWSVRVATELAAVILFPIILAYIFWDVAMRKGNAVLVVSSSYLTPILSTLISCVYLRVSPKPMLWVACAMVVGGAIICRRSVAD
jgi:drug/metabolite transporter (DMT)-like permease